MSNKKQLKNIANGLLCSFISRNNDVNGYWGIGKLYALMMKSKSLVIDIDLVENTIFPNDNELKLLVFQYSKQLKLMLRKQSIDFDSLHKVLIVLKGYPNNSILPLAPHKIHCKITIIDALKECTIEKEVWCREHDPKLESKRASYKYRK